MSKKLTNTLSRSHRATTTPSAPLRGRSVAGVDLAVRSFPIGKPRAGESGLPVRDVGGWGAPDSSTSRFPWTLWSLCAPPPRCLDSASCSLPPQLAPVPSP